MNVNWSLLWRLIEVIISVIFGVIVARAVERRAKLTTYFGHMAEFHLKDYKGILRTHTIVISNPGKLASTNVRVCHKFLPPAYQVAPVLPHKVEQLDDGGQDIVFDRLIPGEQLNISYLYFAPTQWHEIHRGIKSDEGYASVISVVPQRLYPEWIRRTMVFLALVGAISFLYLVMEAVFWGFRLAK